MKSSIKRIVKLIVSLFWFVIRGIGRGMLRLIGIKVAGKCMVLMYHEVLAEQSEAFRRQIAALSRYTHIIPAHTGQVLEKGVRYAAITFDDGFVCLKDSALPLLAARQIPFSVFIPVHSIGRKPGWEHHGDDTGAFAILGEKDIKDLVQTQGVTIGSHSLSHPDFSSLTEKQVRLELADSKTALERITGKSVTGFAYPFGSMDSFDIAVKQELGYNVLFSIIPAYTVFSADKIIVGRIRVDPTDWPCEFFLKIMGAYNWEPLAYRLKALLLFPFKKNG